jgi:hypothetical protein
MSSGGDNELSPAQGAGDIDDAGVCVPLLPYEGRPSRCTPSRGKLESRGHQPDDCSSVGGSGALNEPASWGPSDHFPILIIVEV